MSIEQLLWGIFSGDMGALSVLFVMLLPAVLLYALGRQAVQSVKDKLSGKPSRDEIARRYAEFDARHQDDDEVAW